MTEDFVALVAQGERALRAVVYQYAIRQHIAANQRDKSKRLEFCPKRRLRCYVGEARYFQLACIDWNYLASCCGCHMCAACYGQFCFLGRLLIKAGRACARINQGVTRDGSWQNFARVRKDLTVVIRKR